MKSKPGIGEAVEGRRKAAWLLSELGAAAKPAMQALVTALEDDAELVSQEAAKALGAIGPDAKDAIPALIEALKFKTQNAVRALASIAPGEPRVAMAIIDAFEDRAYPSRENLLYVMSDLKSEKKRLETVLLAAHEEGDKQFRSTSAYALYRIGANSKEALAAIRAWQKENAPLSDPGNVSVPALIEKVRNPKDRMDDLNAFQQLSRFGPKAAAAVPALIDYLNDPSARYRLNAANVLAAIGPAAKDAVPTLIALLKDSKYTGRANAVSALGEIGPAAKDAVPALIEALKEDDRGVSGNAPRALGLIGPAAKAAIPLLERALQDSDRRFRMQAAAYLWRIDTAFISVSVPIMIEAIENPPRDSGNPSFYLSKALGDIGPPAKEALPVLRQVFDRPDDFGRWTAASALCRIDPTQVGAILPQMIRALEDEDNSSRGGVAYGLGEMGPLAVSAIPALTAALKADDANLKEQAARALEKISPGARR
jgi:HEAT repeat protein